METNRLVGLLVLVVVLLVGCQLKPEYAAAPPAISSRDCPSRPETSRTSSELLAGTPTAKGETIAALGFTGDGQTMFVAYSREPASRGGRLIQIRVSDWQVLRTIELDDLNERFTQFNGDATLLASFHQAPCRADRPNLCYDLRVWRTTGELMPQQKFTVTDMVAVNFAKQSTWLLAVAPGGFNIVDPISPSSGVGSAVPTGEQFECLVTGALNNSANLVAYATQPLCSRPQGRIRVEGWDGHFLDMHNYTFGLGPFRSDVWPSEDLDHVPLGLAIAPNNKWLAIQSAEGLELRDISSGFFPQQAKVSLPRTSAGVLEFNPSGSLLAVGYSKGTRVYSVPDLRLVLDKPGPPTTTLTFSSDGCVLAWADEQGTVHIISTPQP